MAEIKKISTNKDGLTTMTVELAQEEIIGPVVDQTIKLLATGLGNQLITEYMQSLIPLFTDKFRVIIAEMLAESTQSLAEKARKMSEEIE